MRAQDGRSGGPLPRPTRRLVLAGGAGLLLGACGRQAPDPVAAPAVAPSPGAGGPARPLLWAGRPGGLDGPAGGASPSLADFTRRTGIAARYLPELATDRDAWAMLAAASSRGRWAGRDVVVLGEAAAARAVAAGWAEPLGPDALPGTSGLAPALLSAPGDPGRHFSLPWRSSYVGLVWDTGKVREPLVSVDDLRRPALHGRVVLPREWSDGLGLVALAQGHRVDGPAAAVGDALDQALGVVERLGRDGQLLAAGDPVEMLRQGRAAAGIARSADVQRLQAAAPGRFSFVVPDTGALLVTDDLVVPRGTDRRADVLRLLDHYLQPAVAAVVARTVPGLCPVPAARDVLATVDARRAASPLVFPTDADLARCQLLTVLDADAEARYADAYLTIAGPAHG